MLCKALENWRELMIVVSFILCKSLIKFGWAFTEMIKKLEKRVFFHLVVVFTSNAFEIFP